MAKSKEVIEGWAKVERKGKRGHPFLYSEIAIMFLATISQLFHAPSQAKGRFCIAEAVQELLEQLPMLMRKASQEGQRLTGLTKEIPEHLLSFTPDMGGVRIGGAVFSIVNAATTAKEHPEAGQDDYIAL